jgi:hypothetical protein
MKSTRMLIGDDKYQPRNRKQSHGIQPRSLREGTLPGLRTQRLTVKLNENATGAQRLRGSLFTSGATNGVDPGVLGGRGRQRSRGN